MTVGVTQCARWLCPSDDPTTPFGPWPLWLFDIARTVVIVGAFVVVVLALVAAARCALRTQQARFAAVALFAAVAFGTEADHLGDHASWRLAANTLAVVLLLHGLWSFLRHEAPTVRRTDR